MNKKYEAPQLDIQYFDIKDRVTSDMEFTLSNTVDEEFGTGPWEW